MFGFEMISQNMDDGYPEAVCRALGKSFVTKETYENLVTANNLNEYMLMLEETDYAKYLISSDGSAIEPNDLKRRLYTKLRDEMEYIMGQACQPLSTFLQMMMHSY
jgi:V-type H+-transporting ATPase subunit d